MHCPLRRIAADSFGELFRTLGEKIAEPTFALRGHIEEFVDRFHVAPFELQAIGLLRTKESFFPCLESDAGAAGKVAALDAEIVDLLGEIQHCVTLDSKIEKSIEPLAARVEVHDGSFEFSFAKLCVPRAHARALKAGPQDHIVLAEAVNVCRR